MPGTYQCIGARAETTTTTEIPDHNHGQVLISFVTWIYDDMCLALACALLEGILLYRSCACTDRGIEFNMIKMTTSMLRSIRFGTPKRIAKYAFNSVGDLSNSRWLRMIASFCQD